MKILTHLILIAVVSMSTIFLASIAEENHRIEFPIDTPGEVIEFEKTDKTTQIQLKKDATDQVDKSKTFTICDSKLGEKTIEGKINIEPILKRIIESDFQPSSEIIRIEGNVYKVPPDVGETVLVNLYTPNKPTENLYHKLEILGASPSKYYYYHSRGSIKTRIPITNITRVSSLSEITDIRRVINFPLMTKEYNIRVENGKQYYNVFLDVENHAPTDAMNKTLDDFGVIIIRRYNDGITDFRVNLPLDNLTTVAELPFVTHIEFHDIPGGFCYNILNISIPK